MLHNVVIASISLRHIRIFWTVHSLYLLWIQSMDKIRGWPTWTVCYSWYFQGCWSTAASIKRIASVIQQIYSKHYFCITLKWMISLGKSVCQLSRWNPLSKLLLLPESVFWFFSICLFYVCFSNLLGFMTCIVLLLCLIRFCVFAAMLVNTLSHKMALIWYSFSKLICVGVSRQKEKWYNCKLY